MKSKILLLALTVLFFTLVPVQAGDGDKNVPRVQQKNITKPSSEEQSDDIKAFHESLKGMSTKERVVAFKEYLSARHQKNNNSKDSIKKENAEFLKKMLQDGGILKNAQTDELIDLFESQYLVAAPLKNSKYDGDVAFFIQVSRDPVMSQEQKKEIISEYFRNKKEEAEKLIDEKNSKVSGGKSGSWSGVDSNEFSPPTIKK
ncbi:MAG: hypothetical protein WC450_00145 [Candidatus Omnitrophota bacterium]|jgi:hypothetical protein